MGIERDPHQFSMAECVGPGHPDKVCDQIADAVVDACLDGDRHSRCAIETLGKGSRFVLGGEVTTSIELTADRLASIVNGTYRDIGYSGPLEVVNLIERQSPEIAQGVNTGGAGDQGVMVGYFTNATASGLPPAMDAARTMIGLLEGLRISRELPWLGPDCKSQVCIVNHLVADVVLAALHDAEIPIAEVRTELQERVITPALELADLSAEGARVTINGTGSFVVGGFAADAGVVGRKIVVDQFGPDIPVGGGAFSGKDPTKVDRSAAYMARFVARAVVESGDCNTAIVRVAYAIGQAEPCALLVWTDRGGLNPGDRPSGLLSERVSRRFDWRPRAIIERFGLDKPAGWSYQEAARGPYGRADILFPWEQSVSGVL
jgi:S-adenosylmethionine synthetase